MTYHKPVLLTEVIEALQITSCGRYLDLTMGGGGHGMEIVKNLDIKNGLYIGVDQDADAVGHVAGVFTGYDNVRIYRDNFSSESLWQQLETYGGFDGILMDLGVSSHQLDAAERGFSFREDAPLDMRMSDTMPITAEHLVNRTPERELADIIYMYGEERRSRQIARKICAQRPISTTKQLAEIIGSCFSAKERHSMNIHPATRTFQALRIAVNGELDALEKGLKHAINALNKEGRLCVISYHSLEDRIVKQLFKRESTKCVCDARAPICTCGHEAQVRVVNKKVVIPTDEEQNENPRSRSAKMRVVEKL